MSKTRFPSPFSTATPASMFATPGPLLAMQTPSLPVSRAYAPAMCAATASWRGEIISIPSSTQCANSCVYVPSTIPKNFSTCSCLSMRAMMAPPVVSAMVPSVRACAPSAGLSRRNTPRTRSRWTGPWLRWVSVTPDKLAPSGSESGPPPDHAGRRAAVPAVRLSDSRSIVHRNRRRMRSGRAAPRRAGSHCTAEREYAHSRHRHIAGSGRPAHPRVDGSCSRTHYAR